MTPLEPQSPQPLYIQLANELRSAIRRGDLTPGQRLPSERELIETYSTSRTTVRMALGLLKAESLVSAGPGRGTYVRRKPLVRLEFSRFRHGRQDPGLGPFQTATRRAGVHGEVRVLTVEQQVADAELATRLGIQEGDPVVARSRHMLANGFLVQLYDGYYPLAIVEGTEIATSPRVTGGIYAGFERTGIHPATATEEISARAPTPEEATLLRLGSGVPVLTVTRTTYDETGRALEVLEVVASAETNVFVYERLPLD